jgi:hypothetical protein
MTAVFRVRSRVSLVVQFARKVADLLATGVLLEADGERQHRQEVARGGAVLADRDVNGRVGGGEPHHGPHDRIVALLGRCG